MNVFEAVKQNVTTRQAAELYGMLQSFMIELEVIK